MDEEIANNAVQYVLAKAAAERVTNYVSRGRKHKDLSLEQLQTEFEETLRAYVADGRNHVANDDVHAEFELRKLEPSYDAVMPLVDELVSRAKEVATTRDSQLDIGGSIISDYFKSFNEQQ